MVADSEVLIKSATVPDPVEGSSTKNFCSTSGESAPDPTTGLLRLHTSESCPDAAAVERMEVEEEEEDDDDDADVLKRLSLECPERGDELVPAKTTKQNPPSVSLAASLCPGEGASCFLAIDGAMEREALGEVDEEVEVREVINVLLTAVEKSFDPLLSSTLLPQTRVDSPVTVEIGSDVEEEEEEEEGAEEKEVSGDISELFPRAKLSIVEPLVVFCSNASRLNY